MADLSLSQLRISCSMVEKQIYMYDPISGNTLLLSRNLVADGSAEGWRGLEEGGTTNFHYREGLLGGGELHAPE